MPVPLFWASFARSLPAPDPVIFWLSKKYAASGPAKGLRVRIAWGVFMRPPFAGVRSGDFLAEQKIRGIGFCKGLEGWDCLELVVRPPFAGVRSGDFLAEQKIRGIGSCKWLEGLDCLGGSLWLFLNRW